MAKAQKRSGREGRKTKSNEPGAKTKVPKYLRETETTHVQIPAHKPEKTGGAPAK
jgi:hypothetical protein